MARRITTKSGRCKFGKITRGPRKGRCRKAKKSSSGGTRRRRTTGRKYSAKGGRYCVTVTKPGTGKKALAFSTKCHRSKDAALADLTRRSTGAYSAMIHRPGKKRRARRR